MAEQKTEQVRLQKDGSLMFEDLEGVKTLVAKFDRKSGNLEWESRELANKPSMLRRVTAAIGSVENGVKPSGLQITTMTIKGVAGDKPAANIPPKPKRDPIFGDQTPALVKWYFEHRPQEAYIRYGVFLDDKGEPIRRTVKRKSTEIIDDRSGEYGIHDSDSKGEKVGAKTWENGPILKRAYIDTLDNQMVARRATCMTYAPIEVVGGFDTGDDENEVGVNAEGEANE